MLKTLLDEAELAWFETTTERQGLEKIKRYSIYHPMFYRADVWNHSLRATMLVAELIPSFKRHFHFDDRKAILMMLVHDDPELITGDELAGHKAKMTAEQLHALAEAEHRAVSELVERFPRMIGSYVYEELLHEVNEKRSIESQIVQICDKLDAVGESFHEVLAGNTAFTTHVVDHFGKIELPLEFLHRFLKEFADKYPEVGAKLPEIASFLPIEDQNWPLLATNRRLHTEENLTHPSGFAAYDFWKGILLKRDRERQIALLTTKTE